MALKHAILGFLIERPMHGYELKRALSPALSMNDGVLYPLLDRMTREHLLSKRIERRPDAPARHVLVPTKKGEELFRTWLEGGESEEDEVSYDFFLGQPFLAKCMFFSRLAPAEVRAKLRGQRERAAKKLDDFRAIRRGMIARGVDPFRIAIIDLGITQQRDRVRWLDRLIEQPPRKKGTKK